MQTGQYSSGSEYRNLSSNRAVSRFDSEPWLSDYDFKFYVESPEIEFDYIVDEFYFATENDVIPLEGFLKNGNFEYTEVDFQFNV